jgi:CheY-like chemotaxis protein
MDFEMPVLNGIQATKKLRAMMDQGIIKSFPIVAVTAYFDERDACFEAGMSDFCKFWHLS